MEGVEQDWLEVLERQRVETKFANFRGVARVKLSHLSFPNPPRPIDPTNIKRLKRSFKTEGCLRIDPEHHIPAIVHEEALQTALENANISKEKLKGSWGKDLAELLFADGLKLECLHGQHRVIAAEQCLYPEENKWWVVDLYGHGKSPGQAGRAAWYWRLTKDVCPVELTTDAKEWFRNGYSYCKKYEDGLIFRYMRLFARQGDACAERRWRSRLSPTKERDVKKLFRRESLTAAFDSLLPVKGFWTGKALKLGSLDNVLSQRCDEVGLSPSGSECSLI